MVTGDGLNDLDSGDESDILEDPDFPLPHTSVEDSRSSSSKESSSSSEESSDGKCTHLIDKIKHITQFNWRNYHKHY